MVEPHHKSDIFQHLCRANPHLQPVFALYFNSQQDVLTSAITFGSVDKTRMQRRSPWQHLKVIPYPVHWKYAYWAVKLVSFVVVSSTSAKTPPRHALYGALGTTGGTGGDAEGGAGSNGVASSAYDRLRGESSNYCDPEQRDCVAVVDSGTSFVGIGMFAFDEVMRTVLRNPKLSANCDRNGRLGANYYSCLCTHYALTMHSLCTHYALTISASQ
jgi:hypothetical protein